MKQSNKQMKRAEQAKYLGSDDLFEKKVPAWYDSH